MDVALQHVGMVFIADMLFVVSMVFVIYLTICVALQHKTKGPRLKATPQGPGRWPMGTEGPHKIFCKNANSRCLIFCSKIFCKNANSYRPTF